MENVSEQCLLSVAAPNLKRLAKGLRLLDALGEMRVTSTSHPEFLTFFRRKFRSVRIRAANVHDSVSGINAAIKAYQNWPTVSKFCANNGYRGAFVYEVNGRLLMSAEIPQKRKPLEWEILPWRRIVERAFARLNHSRRLGKDYEVAASSALAMVKTSHFHTLLKRL